MKRRRAARLGAVLLVAVLAALAIVSLAGSTDEEPPPVATAPPEDTTARGPEREPQRTPDPASYGRLAIGIGENNANLLWANAARPELPDPALDPWRDRVEQLRPEYYRLLVDWSALQPDPGRPADLSIPEDGCLRGQAPCGAYAGIRERLRAVRSQQEAHGGWRVLVVLYGVPDWAARPAGGCEPPDTLPRSRPITDAGLEGYRALIGRLLEVAAQEGVALRWWSPWNEPNGAYFLSPQRDVCDRLSPSRAPAVYTRLVEAARAELRARGADHRLMLGELAGNDGPSPRATGIDEFVGALPDRVACAGDVWAQHDYAERGSAAYEGAVGQLRRALDRRACTRGKPIWVTETGIGNAGSGRVRDTSPAALRADCRSMAGQLRKWYREPRVEVAVQYTFREDTLFPVGLADAGLTRAYPTYELWRAWGARPSPDAPPPGRCRR